MTAISQMKRWRHANREKGFVTLAVLILLSVMLILISVNSVQLCQLNQGLKQIERKQIQNLNTQKPSSPNLTESEPRDLPQSGAKKRRDTE